MGCGGSKEEVATANTVAKRSLFRRKSSVSIGKSSVAENQTNTKSENPGKIEEETEDNKKAKEKTEVSQNSGDKTEIPRNLTEKKIETVEKAEEKTEVMEKPESESVAKPKNVKELEVVKTDDEAPLPESTNINSLMEEAEKKVVKLNEAAAIDGNLVVGKKQEAHDSNAKEEIKNSTVIVGASQKKEEFTLSKEADVVVESTGENSSELKQTTSTEEGTNAELKETLASTEEVNANSKEELASTEEVNVELKETLASTEEVIAESKEALASTEEANEKLKEALASTEDAKTEELQMTTSTEEANNELTTGTTSTEETDTKVAILEEKPVEENAATKESDK